MILLHSLAEFVARGDYRGHQVFRNLKGCEVWPFNPGWLHSVVLAGRGHCIWWPDSNCIGRSPEVAEVAFFYCIQWLHSAVSGREHGRFCLEANTGTIHPHQRGEMLLQDAIVLLTLSKAKICCRFSVVEDRPLSAALCLGCTLGIRSASTATSGIDLLFLRVANGDVTR